MMKKTLAIIVLSLFSSSSIAASMCGYAAGNSINLSSSYTGMTSGGCCTVQGVDYDAGYNSYVMRVRCSDCYSASSAWGMSKKRTYTFSSCGDIYSAQ